jgi:glutathione S-transferase
MRGILPPPPGPRYPPRMAQPIVQLYQYAPSGNCYKVRLLLAQLGIPFETHEIQLRMTPEVAREFKKINPLGRVPAVVLPDGKVLAESNAILCYFAEGTPYLPDDRLARAETLQWLFWEQYDHEPYVAVVRAWVKFFGVPAGREKELEERRARAHGALDVMERHLGEHDWFSAGRYTVADIALYAYTHVGADGGLALERYPAIGRWMERVRSQPGHLAIE